MGGESIKPIRKRIHVYFLMTAYNEYNDLSIINNINDVLSIDQQKIYFLN